MALALLLAVQAAAAPPSAEAEPLPPLRRLDFDLARPLALDTDVTRQRCARDDPETILVCGRRNPAGTYPLEQWQRIFREEPLVARGRLFGNVVGQVYGETAILDRGEASQRIMVRLRLPF